MLKPVSLGENAISFELTAMDADTPLTMMMMAAEGGKICVINPPEGMQYSINNGNKEFIYCDMDSESFCTDVNQNDKVSFYGDRTRITDYSDGFGDTFIINASGLLLPATELVDRCYASMFNGCGTIEQVTCLATTIKDTDTDCTKYWLDGVSNNNPFGEPTFTKAKDVNWWTTGPSGIPSGWTVKEE